jgi:hypothetical protein
MSQTGSMPKSAKALEIPTTHCNNRIASAMRSLVIPSVSAWAWSSSADKSHPSEECRTHSSSSANITSCTSKSTAVG